MNDDHFIVSPGTKIRWEATEGLPFPLGPTRIEEEDAYNFALYSKHAESVTLLLWCIPVIDIGPESLGISCRWSEDLAPVCVIAIHQLSGIGAASRVSAPVEISALHPSCREQVALHRFHQAL